MKKLVTTFGQVDFSDIKVPVIAIYNNPSDYRGYFVARIWDLNVPTDTLMLKKDVESIRQDIRKHLPDLVRLPRKKCDDKCLIETWL